MVRGKLKCVWISRNAWSRADVRLWARQPQYRAGGYYEGDRGRGSIDSFCYRLFKRVTGLMVRQGECFRADVVVRRRKSKGGG